MANQASLSNAQVRVLAAFLKKHVPASLDKLANEVGAEDALRLLQLKERMERLATTE